MSPWPMVGLSPFHLEPAPFSIKIPRNPSISLNLSKIRTFFSFYCLQLLEILTAAALMSTVILLLLKFIQKLLKETWSHPKVPHSHTTTSGDSFQWFQVRLRVGEERGVASSPKIIKHENYFFIDFQKSIFLSSPTAILGIFAPLPKVTH